MSETVTLIGLSSLLRRIRYFRHDLADRRIMAEIGDFIIARIQTRTSKGEDSDNNKFEPYSPAYKLFRERTGHSGSIVNLFYTGSMMSAMTRDADDDEVRVYFMNTSDESGIKNPVKAFFLDEERPFFSINETDRQMIHGILERHMRRLRRRRR